MLASGARERERERTIVISLPFARRNALVQRTLRGLRFILRGGLDTVPGQRAAYLKFLWHLCSHQHQSLCRAQRYSLCGTEPEHLCVVAHEHCSCAHVSTPRGHRHRRRTYRDRGTRTRSRSSIFRYASLVAVSGVVARLDLAGGKDEGGAEISTDHVICRIASKMKRMRSRAVGATKLRRSVYVIPWWFELPVASQPTWYLPAPHVSAVSSAIAAASSDYFSTNTVRRAAVCSARLLNRPATHARLRYQI